MSGRFLFRRRPAWFGLAAVLALLVAGWGLTRGEPVDEWVTVARDDLSLGVEATGTLASTDSSILGPPQIREAWTFKISFLAPEGEEVAEGNPVLAFDTSDLERSLKTLETETRTVSKEIEKTVLENGRKKRERALRLAEAEAKLRKAEMAAEVPPELEKAAERKKAELELKEARMEVDWLREQQASEEKAGQALLSILNSREARAEQRVESLRTSIARMTMKAPRNGTVIYVTDWEGKKKKVGDSCWRGQKVVELPDLTSLKATGFVEEADAAKIAPGQPVRLVLDAHPDRVYEGKVESIWETVERKNWRTRLKVFRLDLSLAETDSLRMRPGMRFTGTIETEHLEDVLVLPVTAVFPSKEGPVVFRKTLFGHEKVPVETGRKNETSIRILSGLREGDQVAGRNMELETAE